MTDTSVFRIAFGFAVAIVAFVEIGPAAIAAEANEQSGTHGEFVLAHCCHPHPVSPYDDYCCHPPSGAAYVAPRAYGVGPASVRGVSRRTSRRTSRRVSRR